MDSAKAALAVADANLVRAERRHQAKDIIDLELNESRVLYEKAKADLMMAEAEVKVKDFNLRNTTIRSPISGRIGRAFSGKGTYVSRDQSNPLAMVFQIDPVYVEFTQPVNWILDLQESLRIGELRDGGDEKTEVIILKEIGQEYGYRGQVQFSKATINDDTGTLLLRAEFPNPDKELIPGMTVNCRIVLKPTDGE